MFFRRKAPYFVSDFTDFFHGRWSQSFAAVIFLFFANITSIITFGAVMERALHHQIVRAFFILILGSLTDLNNEDSLTELLFRYF